MIPPTFTQALLDVFRARHPEFDWTVTTQEDADPALARPLPLRDDDREQEAA